MDYLINELQVQEWIYNYNIFYALSLLILIKSTPYKKTLHII